MAREIRRHAAGRDEPVLQPRVVFEDLAQCRGLALDLVRLAHQGFGFRRAEGNLDAARHDAIHHEAVPEDAIVEAQPLFLEPHELHEREGEGGIVAERSEVAEVVRDALALEHERAQPPCARRRNDREDRFRGLRIRPRECNRRISRHASRESISVGDGEGFEALVDALVRVAQALLEAQYLFAYDGETEVAGLDDARMDGPDRNLVHAVALDPHEGIRFLHVGRGGSLEILAQWKFVLAPGAVTQPRAIVIGTVRRDAEEVAKRALHAARRWKEAGEVGIGGIARRHGKLDDDEAGPRPVGGVNGERSALAMIRAPQGDEASSFIVRAPCRLDPLLRRHARKRRGNRSRKRPRRDPVVAHVSRGASPPACTRQRGKAECRGRASVRAPGGRRRA